MRFNKTTIAIFLTLTCTCSTSAIAEYKTNSVFSDDYKCVSEEKGGFNHGASGHSLNLFKGQEEFFLTHISNIPYEALVDWNQLLEIKLLNIKANDESKIREIFEERIMKQETLNIITTEKHSYFIRQPEDDPKKFQSLLNACSSFKAGQEAEITCYESDGSQTFKLNLETMRFTYSYAGSWHSKIKKGYYGDASVFAFGTCKKYFH